MDAPVRFAAVGGETQKGSRMTTVVQPCKAILPFFVHTVWRTALTAMGDASFVCSAGTNNTGSCPWAVGLFFPPLSLGRRQRSGQRRAGRCRAGLVRG